MMWMDYLAIGFLTTLILVLIVKMTTRSEPRMRHLIRDVDGEPAPVMVTAGKGAAFVVTTRR